MINFFKTILYNPLYNLLIFFVWLTPGHSIGWAIIAVTLLVRIALLPSSLKASRSQVRLQMLQPEMNRIKVEIKDKQAQGKALMDLYKREGVSPFSSCLPLLIQLPILIILYQVFRAGTNIDNFSSLYSFIPRPETINPNFLWLNLSVADPWILPIIAGLSQFWLSKLTMPPTPKPALVDGKPAEVDPMMMMNKQMIYLFPLMTIYIAHKLPAALAIYWIVTTVFGIIQQVYVNKTIKKKPEFQAEVKLEEQEIEEEIKELQSPEILKEIKTEKKKPDFMTKIMNKRLDKQEKKTGVEVTIRKKQ